MGILLYLVEIGKTFQDGAAFYYSRPRISQQMLFISAIPAQPNGLGAYCNRRKPLLRIAGVAHAQVRVGDEQARAPKAHASEGLQYCVRKHGVDNRRRQFDFACGTREITDRPHRSLLGVCRHAPKCPLQSITLCLHVEHR